MTPLVDGPRVVVGDQLRKARETLAFSPEEAATRLHVMPSDITDWENGQTDQTPFQVEQLALVYGREIDYFLHGTSDPPALYRFRAAPRQAVSALSTEA